MKKIRIGTRGSLLATTQTGMVKKALELANPDIEFELVIVKTQGDLQQKISLSQFGSQGVFIKELEDALEKKEVDLAVHSLKDVPHQIPENMDLVSFFPRENPFDVLVSNGKTFAELPEGAKVGTGSPRRIVQLANLRPDLKFLDLRGNIDTRLGKVTDGELDGIILARAGLNRVERGEVVDHEFGVEELVPAIAQGIVAIEARKGDAISRQVARSVNDTEAELAAQVERAFMEWMGGGCKVPLAALAVSSENQIRFTTCLGDLESKQLHKKRTSFPVQNWKSELQAFVNSFKNECVDLGLKLPDEQEYHQLIADREKFFGEG